MKEKASIKNKIAVVGIIALTVFIIGVISVPNVLKRTGVQVGEKEGEEAGTAQVLSGKTFTSSLAGVGAAGAMADYTQNLQTATIASNATGVSTINIPAGYYEQIQVDASAVYEKGKIDGRIFSNKGLLSLYQKGNTNAEGLYVGSSGTYQYAFTNRVYKNYGNFKTRLEYKDIEYSTTFWGNVSRKSWIYYFRK